MPLETPRPKRKYQCTQPQLYAICKIGWKSYEENQAAFELFNTNYTVLFGTNAVAAVAAAKALPDFQQRDEPSETAFILMGKKADKCIISWKTLRSYIKKAFDPDLFKPKIESAGYNYYEEATNENWEDLDSMLLAGQSFITNNTPALTTAGMPAGFPASYNTLYGEFGDLYETFTDAGQDSKEGTDAKITANNDIHKTLTDMFADGQLIFAEDAGKRERFIFARVKAIVKLQLASAAATTYQGGVTSTLDDQPIPNVACGLMELGTSVPTNAEGAFLMEDPERGIHTGIFVHPDYEELQVPGIEIKAGEATTINVQLTPLTP